MVSQQAWQTSAPRRPHPTQRGGTRKSSAASHNLWARGRCIASTPTDPVSSGPIIPCGPRCIAVTLWRTSILRSFRVLSPTTVNEAAAELQRLGDQAAVYAGGAELLLLMRQGLAQPDYLIDIKRIAPLRRLDWDGKMLRLGAATTHREIEFSPQVT